MASPHLLSLNHSPSLSYSPSLQLLVSARWRWPRKPLRQPRASVGRGKYDMGLSVSVLNDCIHHHYPAYTNARSPTPGRFSAICYLSARDTFAKSGHAVGLIETDYGGTPIQAWSPPDALEACAQPLDDCDGESMPTP